MRRIMAKEENTGRAMAPVEVDEPVLTIVGSIFVDMSSCLTIVNTHRNGRANINFRILADRKEILGSGYQMRPYILG